MSAGDGQLGCPERLPKKARYDDGDTDDTASSADDMFVEDQSMWRVENKRESKTITFDDEEKDDPEGFLVTKVGQTIWGKYRVTNNVGRGVYGSVVKASDEDGIEVAIKILRNNPVMLQAGLKEDGFLSTLLEADPDGKMNVVRLLTRFDYHGHLCLVFESLSMNLRDLLHRFGKDVGLNLKAVRIYAKQLFTALGLLKKCGIVHGDIKPDNILVSESKNMVKLCDFGTAFYASSSDVAPYRASRFYRAPEISKPFFSFCFVRPLVIGLLCGHQSDVWAVACTLYELYTGRILFAGRSNNQMLKLIMDMKGRMPAKMIRRGQYASKHFAVLKKNEFLYEDPDASQRSVREIVYTNAPVRDLKMHMSSFFESDPLETQSLVQFIDLLARCLSIDPERRYTVRDALKHPFIANKP